MTKHKFYLEEVTIWIIMPILYVITFGSRQRVRGINLSRAGKQERRQWGVRVVMCRAGPEALRPSPQ